MQFLRKPYCVEPCGFRPPPASVAARGQAPRNRPGCPGDRVHAFFALQVPGCRERRQGLAFSGNSQQAGSSKSHLNLDGTAVKFSPCETSRFRPSSTLSATARGEQGTRVVRERQSKPGARG